MLMLCPHDTANTNIRRLSTVPLDGLQIRPTYTVVGNTGSDREIPGLPANKVTIGLLLVWNHGVKGGSPNQNSLCILVYLARRSHALQISA